MKVFGNSSQLSREDKAEFVRRVERMHDMLDYQNFTKIVCVPEFQSCFFEPLTLRSDFQQNTIGALAWRYLMKAQDNYRMLKERLDIRERRLHKALMQDETKAKVAMMEDKLRINVQRIVREDFGHDIPDSHMPQSPPTSEAGQLGILIEAYNKTTLSKLIYSKMRCACEKNGEHEDYLSLLERFNRLPNYSRHFTDHDPPIPPKNGNRGPSMTGKGLDWADWLPKPWVPGGAV